MFQLPKSTNLKYAKFTGFLKLPAMFARHPSCLCKLWGVPAAPGLDSGWAQAPLWRRVAPGMSPGLSEARAPHLPEEENHAVPHQPRGQGEKSQVGPTASSQTDMHREPGSNGDMICHESEAMVLSHVHHLTLRAGKDLGNCLAWLLIWGTESQAGQGASVVNRIIPPKMSLPTPGTCDQLPPMEKGLCRGDVKHLQRGCEPGLLRWPRSRHRCPKEGGLPRL